MSKKKKIVLALLTSILITFILLALSLYMQTRVFADELTPTDTTTSTPEVTTYEGGYEKAYKDYLSQVETYRDAHQEYILRKSQYERFMTLQSQQDAQEATATMLKERDGVVVSYFTALKERLREQGKTNNSAVSELSVLIDNQISWFSDHKDKVPSAGSLKDLAKDSDEAQEQFKDATPLIYEVLGSISSGRLTDMSERLNDRFTELKEKLDKIRADDREEYQLSSEKLQTLDRWIFDSEFRIQRFSEKQNEADSLLLGLNGISRISNAGKIYSQVIEKLLEAKQYLKESSSYMLEILSEIRTEEE